MAHTMDVTYTNGLIAAREKYLLKDKIFRFCELSAEEVFRSLLESGFGGGAETAASVYDYENLITAEQAALDAFIREYAPSEAEKAYLLSARDFHNAKAMVKAAFLGQPFERMLTGEGLVDSKLIADCVENGNFAPLKAVNSYLGGACEEATEYLQENSSGAKVGGIFENALQNYLWEISKGKKVLRKLLVAKADMTNVLTALRCGDKNLAKEQYLSTGSLTAQQLDALFLEDRTQVERAFEKTAYLHFVKQCLDAKEKRMPMTEAEKIKDGYDVEYFASRKFDLSKTEPFLYYVYRRRAESANVRVIFVCLLAGLGEHDVKKRLRAW